MTATTDIRKAVDSHDSWRTFREERREAIDAILASFFEGRRDPDQDAAAAALLDHLMRFPAPRRIS